MLEQLAEVAILREANMRDRTEAATLDAAVAALGYPPLPSPAPSPIFWMRAEPLHGSPPTPASQ